MKNLALIILFLTISLSFSDEPSPVEETLYCSDRDGENASFEICQTLTPDEEAKYCCFFSYEVNGEKGKSCISMTKEEYEDRNGYITNLKNNNAELENLKAKIYCAGDEEPPEDIGDGGENGGGGNGDGENPDDGSITCEEYPNGFDDELDKCKKLTPAKGNYCCLLSYDNGKDKGDACISISKDEYEDRNKAITKLQLIEGYSNAKGKILCDGDKTEDSGSTVLKITKDILALLLVFL